MTFGGTENIETIFSKWVSCKMRAVPFNPKKNMALLKTNRLLHYLSKGDRRDVVLFRENRDPEGFGRCYFVMGIPNGISTFPKTASLRNPPTPRSAAKNECRA